MRVAPGGYSNAATILFGNYSAGEAGASAFAFFPGSTAPSSVAGDVWVNISLPDNQDLTPGNFGMHILAHEIGHAIGLSHPGDYNGAGADYALNAVYWQDSRAFTVMSYFGSPNVGATLPEFSPGPQFHDIAAAQRLYGPRMTTRTGDTIYGFNSNSGREHYTLTSAAVGATFAIWDAGGVDTLDLSGYSQNADIDLRAGAHSSAGPTADQGPAVFNIAIARGVIIENAIGGAGNDTMTGNAAANRLDGGAGADTMAGGAGNDIYVVDIAGDTLTELVGEGSDTVESTLNWTLAAEFENLTLAGAAAITGDGNALANIIVGNAVSNTLNGFGGADSMDGGPGADVIDGGDGDDVLSGGDGADTINGGAGNDTLYGFGAADLDPQSALIQVDLIASGFASPVFAASAPGDPNRLFVTEKNTGRVLIRDLATNQTLAQPFFDVPAGDLDNQGERGLLGFAFHPDYVANGRAFLSLINEAGDTEIWEITRSADPNIADPASARVMLTVDRTATNHNGGWIGFGPDGYLYITQGDSGGGGDPANAAQNLNDLRGKILRIDINGDSFPDDPSRNYAIPFDNPFANTAGADEIFAYGLRNPWRASFDAPTGALFIGDVGQDAREEINHLAGGSGQNFGWRMLEGTLPTGYPPLSNPPPNDPSLVAPLVEYGHGSGAFQGFAVTGGYVYRGPGGLNGHYVFSDFSSGHLWTLRVVDGAAVDFSERDLQIALTGGDFDQIVSFALDGSGRLYAIGLDGEIHR
ncbi:MAG TPA: hypothetical protein DHW63_06155, partial [Hyphomonadaceae bacterium]|nr:hypothetical protein [Hyphomonadaceae bacterium]